MAGKVRLRGEQAQAIRQIQTQTATESQTPNEALTMVIDTLKEALRVYIAWDTI